jgi:alginate O-acetyltransferase complex protein AlgI
MLFNSFQFFFFFPLAVIAYYVTPRPWRWVTALLGSYYFYMCWKPAFVVLILASTLIDYVVGIGLDHAEKPAARRGLLAASLAVNLGLLFAFKYLQFALTSVENALQLAGLQIAMPHPELLLPVGISFYTFQTLSYTIDVFHRRTPTEYHLGRFATYVAFFPQLVAGPIERSSHLLPQLRSMGTLSFNRFAEGGRLILWGLVKKMCVADLVAVPVNTLFATPERFDGSYLVLGMVLFGVQIYCDFSGYSDIAIGCARIMGIDLMTNFRRPYFARSCGEFWQRWHISLSTWFRDYVYIPLGGNQVAYATWVRNILITFIVSGIWHGAAWTFVVWGGLHALYLLAERKLAPGAHLLAQKLNLLRWRKCLAVIQVAVVYTLVHVAWVFFRAESLPDALDYLARMFVWSHIGLAELDKLGLPTVEVALCFVFPAGLVAMDWIIEKRPQWVMRIWQRGWFRNIVYVAGFYAIILFGVFGQVNFIYFQF